MAKKRQTKRVGGSGVASNDSSVVSNDVKKIVNIAKEVDGAVVHTGMIVPRASSGQKRLRVWPHEVPGIIYFYYVCSGGQKGRVVGDEVAIAEVIKRWEQHCAKHGILFQDQYTNQLVLEGQPSSE
jgi:hypothetical protein